MKGGNICLVYFLFFKAYSKALCYKFVVID